MLWESSSYATSSLNIYACVEFLSTIKVNIVNTISLREALLFICILLDLAYVEIPTESDPPCPLRKWSTFPMESDPPVLKGKS